MPTATIRSDDGVTRLLLDVDDDCVLDLDDTVALIDMWYCHADDWLGAVGVRVIAVFEGDERLSRGSAEAAREYLSRWWEAIGDRRQEPPES